MFKEGKSITVFPYKVFWMIEDNKTGLDTIQFGVGAGTRNFKKAVDRNRIKRLSREAYRLGKTSIEKTLVDSAKHLSLFFIYIGKELPDFFLVQEKTNLILNKICKELNEDHKANT